MLAAAGQAVERPEAIQPELRNLRWAECSAAEFNAGRKMRLEQAEVVGGKIYLDTQYADLVRQDIAKPKVNAAFGGGPITIGNQQYQRGIGTHANSEIVFFLNGKYQRFHAEVGTPGGSVRFTVIADGRAVFDSGVMSRGLEPKPVDLDLSGVSEIRLVVDDGGNGKHADHANWAEAYVIE